MAVLDLTPVIDVGGFASVPSLFEQQPADATNQCDGA